MFATATKRKVMMIAALCGCGMLLGGAGEAMGQTPATSTGLDTPGPGGGNTPSAQADILEIGPIEGLTTGWHPAPDLTSIPVGTQVQFQQFAGADATVVWTGATEISRDSTRSTAECDLKSAGTYIIQAAVVNPNGSIATNVCQLVAVDIAIEDIVVSNPVVSVQPLQVNENSPNYVTMEYFFGESIAALHERAPGHYLTSVDRELTFSIDVDPPEFAPLLEWRVNGEPAALGTPYVFSLYETGVHSISAGPPQFSQEVKVETYSVTITGQFEGDIIPEGVPVTFEAVTDPAGYENRVTWVSSTKYGTAVPVLAQGSTFTVQFDDTFGPDDGWQWLGVKGDNFALGQDQKCVLPGTDCWVTECGRTQVSFWETPLMAGFFGLGSELFDGSVTLGGATGSNHDTEVSRLQAMCFPQFDAPVVIPIEIVVLNLVSCDPIVVTFVDGTSEEWDVAVGLCGDEQDQGEMTVTKTYDNGGTFVSEFPLRPVFTFTKVDDPGEVRVLDTCEFGIPADFLQMLGEGPWVHKADDALDIPDPCGVNFVPGVDGTGGEQCCKDICHDGATATHCIVTGQDCSGCPMGPCCVDVKQVEVLP